MKLNTQTTTIETHAGATAKQISPLQQLERSVMACLLWENNFYESGVEIADRIQTLIKQLLPSHANEVIKLTLKAKNEMHLRHVPLYMTVCLFNAGLKGKRLGDLVYNVIQRPDELAEIIAIYWKDGKKPLPTQFKMGIARAFHKFDEYQLAKYNRDSQIKLRDVLFMTHPKPKNETETALFKAIANNTLKTPDTWEVSLSAGKDKSETFTRLMSENKLGGLAFLRNLRNMAGSGVEKEAIKNYFKKANFSKVLPFRFIAAAKHAPTLESVIEESMLSALKEAPKLKGRTVLVVDNSGSMHSRLSSKSDIERIDAATGLAILLREICEDITIVGFGSRAAMVPDRHGFALSDAIKNGPGGGTDTRAALMLADQSPMDRIILITDEQSHTNYPELKNLRGKNRAYCINVAAYKNGIGYYNWIHVDGFSESIVQYIQANEQ